VVLEHGLFCELYTDLGSHYFYTPEPGAPSKTQLTQVGRALKQDKQASFISRGDRSGTHIAELQLWNDAGIDIDKDNGRWYKSIGQGMGAALHLDSFQEQGRSANPDRR
jgi:ABC-type tungstate transport system permease subunit